MSRARFGTSAHPVIHYVARVADFVNNSGAFVPFLSLALTPRAGRLFVRAHVNGQAAAPAGVIRMRILENATIVRRGWQFASGAATPYEGGDLTVVRDVAPGVPVIYHFELAANGPYNIYCRPTSQADVEYADLSVFEGRAP